MKRALFWLSVLALLVVASLAAAATFVSAPVVDDGGVIAQTRSMLLSELKRRGLSPRTYDARFLDYRRALPFPATIGMGGEELGVQVHSFTGGRVEVATSNTFEVPPTSGYLTNVTWLIRPHADVVAPLLHGEIQKPSVGVKGLCFVELYQVDPKLVPADPFVAKVADRVHKTRNAVARFERTKASGRGENTRYLDPYKSRYRIELGEPDTNKAAYYQACALAAREMVATYFDALELAPLGDAAFAAKHREATLDFVRLLHEKDFVSKLGSFVFGEDFLPYWLDAFWGVPVSTVHRS